MNGDSALRRVTVILEFKAVMVLRINVIGVIRSVDLEWGQTQRGSLEVDKSLEGGCRVLSLCICISMK